jgi:Rrf2 family protein
LRQDSRLSRMLHVLLHMEKHPGPLASSDIARMLKTNATVVRRTLSDLRRAGYVSAIRGNSGGWLLAKPLNKISLLDIYQALGEPKLFALGLSDNSSNCLIEQSANLVIGDSLKQAEKMLLDRFAHIKLSHVLDGVHTIQKSKHCPATSKHP